jgi:hypothetical protein
MASLSSYYPQPVIAGTTAGTFAEGDDSRIVGAVQKSIVDAKGDLIVGLADNTVARLPVGASNGQTLQIDSSTATGLKWAAAAEGGSTPSGPAGGGLAGTYPNPTLAPVTSTGSTTARSLADRFADVVNVRDFGAVGDAKKLTGGSITAGSNVLTCSTASFVAADVGKSISLGYAGTNGHTLYTTISAVNSATQVQLATNAITTTTVSEILYGTEDGPEIRSAITYARSVNKAVYLPRGQYLMNTALSTSTGNPQISSIPVGGGGFGIYLLNTSNTVSQSFYMVGDGASIVSSLYPPQNEPLNDAGFTFVQIGGFFDELHFEGITFDSTRQLALSTTGTGSVGRVYGFRIFGGGGVAWSQNIRPFNTRITNCTFYDQTLSIRADNAENLSVSGCNFLYRRGQAGVGPADWTGAMGVRQIRTLRVTNNYMNGCLADDMNSITTTYEDHRCVDNFVHTGGGGDAVSGEHSQENFLISDNVVTRFAREGIFVIASTNSSYNNDITDGCCIVNNWFDGRYPANHAPTINWAIRTSDAHSTIVGNNIFQATIAILISQSNPPLNGQAAHHTLVDSNNIILCPKSRSGFIGAIGISCGIADNVTIQNNQITGHDVGSYRQNGWTGTGTRPTATVASSSVENNTITVTGNVWPNGSTVFFTSLPANSGLTASSVDYFVVNRIGDTFQVSTSEGGSPVDLLVDISGATITAARPSLTIGIAWGGGSYAPTYSPNPPIITGRIKNNNLKIISKNSPSDLCVAFDIDSGDGTVFIENNTIDGFDFATQRFGGGNLSFIFDNNKITRNLRLPSGYISASYGAPLLRSHLFEIYPTQTGWYEIPVYVGARFGIQFDLSISTNPENRYGDTTTNTQNGSQATKLSVSIYDESGAAAGGTNSRVTVLQNHTGQYPAITKAYARNHFGGFLLYVYVDKVLTKAALTFGGGGGSGAAGYANISNGVIQSPAVITNAGSNYTSAPTVSITEPIAYNIKGSGATFTAVLSGNTVGSVTVGGSGGSGYSQPIYFNVECKNTEYNGIGIDAPVKTATTPSNGMEVLFSAGFKSMTLSGGSGGTKTGNGEPILASTAPSLNATYSTPEFIGQQYINTSTGIAYLAAGTSSSADWKAISFWEP